MTLSTEEAAPWDGAKRTSWTLSLQRLSFLMTRKYTVLCGPIWRKIWWRKTTLSIQDLLASQTKTRSWLSFYESLRRSKKIWDHSMSRRRNSPVLIASDASAALRITSLGSPPSSEMFYIHKRLSLTGREKSQSLNSSGASFVYIATPMRRTAEDGKLRGIKSLFSTQT